MSKSKSQNIARFYPQVPGHILTFVIHEIKPMWTYKIIIAISFFSMITLPISGQIDTMSLKSPEGICAKMLKFISFEKDEEKDWDEYRNLFLPGGQKSSFKSRPGEPLYRQVRMWNIEEFVRYGGHTYPEAGFEEYLIGVNVQEFNGIASVFQSFFCRKLDGSYEARGVNSYQLVFLNDRWWIVNTMFTNETEENKLPDSLLFKEYQSGK